jgi:rod shape-determining protein MreD
MSRDIFRLVVIFVVMFVLHYTLRPILGWRVSIDFILIATMLAAVRVRPGVAAVLGFLVGLLADAQSPTTLGSSALALACVGFSASFLKGSFFAEKSAMTASLFFIGKWAYDLVFLVSEGRFAGSETLAQIFFWSPVAAALTAVAGSLTMLMLQPVLRKSRS